MVSVDMLLYNADQTDATPESGPFGAFATGAQRVAERVMYELQLEPDTVAGRVTGPGLSSVVTGAATTLDAATAFNAAASAVLGRLSAAVTSSTPASDRVVAIGLLSINVSEGVIVFTVRVVTADATVTDHTLTINPPAVPL